MIADGRRRLRRSASAWTVLYSFTNSKLFPSLQLRRPRPVRAAVGGRRAGWSRSRTSAIFGVLSLIFSLVIGFLLAACWTRRSGSRKTVPHRSSSIPSRCPSSSPAWSGNGCSIPTSASRSACATWAGRASASSRSINAETAHLRHPDRRPVAGHGRDHGLMLAGLRGIDEDIWKAARVDGIPTWKTYLFIVTADDAAASSSPPWSSSPSASCASTTWSSRMTSGGPGIASEVPANYVIRLHVRRARTSARAWPPPP